MHHHTEKKSSHFSLLSSFVFSSLVLSCLVSPLPSSLLSVPVFFLCLCLSPCGVVVVMCCVVMCCVVRVLMCVCVSV